MFQAAFRKQTLERRFLFKTFFSNELAVPYSRSPCFHLVLGISLYKRSSISLVLNNVRSLRLTNVFFLSMLQVLTKTTLNQGVEMTQVR